MGPLCPLVKHCEHVPRHGMHAAGLMPVCTLWLSLTVCTPVAFSPSVCALTVCALSFVCAYCVCVCVCARSAMDGGLTALIPVPPILADHNTIKVCGLGRACVSSVLCVCMCVYVCVSAPILLWSKLAKDAEPIYTLNCIGRYGVQHMLGSLPQNKSGC